MVQERGRRFHGILARISVWYSPGPKVQTSLRIRGGLAALAVVAAGGLSSAAAPAAADDVRDRISFNGFMGVEYERQLDAQGFGDPNGSFDSDVIGVAINVHATDRVRVSIESDWEHGASTGAGRGSVNLEYGFVEYAFRDALKVRAGKFLTPFGIFNEIHNVAYTFAPVKLPSPSNRTDRIVKNAYAPHPRWGTGISIHGDLSFGAGEWAYDALLANGDQAVANPFEKDENASKSVAARLRFEPSPHVRVGTSFYWDRTTQAGFDRLMSHGVEADVRQGRVQVLAEGSLGWKRPTAAPTVRQLAGYFQAAYRFDVRLTPYVRLEYVDLLDTDGDSGTNLITGVSYELDRNLFLKLENDHFRGASQNPLGQLPGGGYDELKAAVCFGF
jgi:hypothetical protein